MTERAYFQLCLALGRLLRASGYSNTRMVGDDGATHVRKYRRFYAPLLVFLGDPLVRLLDTGVRVLPQRDWEERERRCYQSLHRTAIQVEADGSLILPRLPGKTLATLLDDPQLDDSQRRDAIELAVRALADLHRLGLTHGDAMAENVMIDVAAAAAHWFDFETVHDPGRPMAWRRADDVRALLTTCLVRTNPRLYAATLQLILDAYADNEVARLLAASFRSVWQRPLTFHLGQAPLSCQCFRQIGRLLHERIGA